MQNHAVSNAISKRVRRNDSGIVSRPVRKSRKKSLAGSLILHPPVETGDGFDVCAVSPSELRVLGEDEAAFGRVVLEHVARGQIDDQAGPEQDVVE